MTPDEELESLRNEIDELQLEIASLQTTHDDLYKHVSVFELEHRHKSLSKPAFPAAPSPHDDHEDAPALIHHSHFDASIERYFRDEPKHSADELAAACDRVLEKVHHKTAAGQLALIESIRRFGGTTAFPINDRLYDTEDDTLLGLRFDILSHVTKRFLTPHYIILRKRQTSEKGAVRENRWLIFRYTTPAYLPLDQISGHLEDEDQERGLLEFVTRVRSFLVYVAFKHEVVDSISALQVPVLTKVEKDLECRRLVFHLKRWPGMKEPTTIELHWGDAIEHVHCNVKEISSKVQSIFMLCKPEHLKDAFVEVFRLIGEHGVS